ncbi:metalloendoproteinase 2-MMP-like [Ipomoea triloba]|uniref:metalloendoproteinase 2-MMP-like n=1 Tax=Ipomoea triloba TaxID=35885 RepID=UPI00125DA390|nr:metalloendoproteinase 2-MMP-like [Ipomoea triloba]
MSESINGGEEDDGFDDFLESAVKTYHANHRLNATGVLDAETVSLLVTPRCGVADIVNGQNLMGRRLGAFHAVSHYASFGSEFRWQWRSVNGPAKTHFSFSETDYETADLKIALFVGDHGDGYPFNGPFGVVTHST